jgi:hypothetical protein
MESKTKEKLQLLSLFLRNLPETIPYADSAHTEYGFDFFAVDDEKVEDMGPIGALNRELECRMGQRHKGPIVFKERGPGLEAVVDVLTGYLDEYRDSSETILLVKWADDLVTAAKAAFTYAGIVVNSFNQYILAKDDSHNLNAVADGRTTSYKSYNS